MIISRLKNKDVITEDAEKVSFDVNYDLIVVGLGTAGAICLIAAARRGLKVLGIEKLTCMGGSATAGGVNSYYYGLSGGFFEEVDQDVKSLEEQLFLNSPDKNSFNQSAKAFSLEKHAVEAGAEFQYEAIATGVYLEENKTVGIEWASPDGTDRASCEFLVDATGDGELAAMAGCRFRYGRDFDGTPQPYSYTRIFAGKDGVRYANFDAGYVDVTDGRSVSDALVHGGRLHLRERFGEKEEKLLTPALQLGQREGRLIIGHETVRFKDFVNGKNTDKPVLYAYANFDTHTQDWAFESEIFQEWLVAASLWGQEVSIPVPAGSLIPRDIDGLLLAGRCLSTDHETSQALRMQKCMQKTGEITAVMADMALKENVPVFQLNYHRLRKELVKNDCLNPNPPSSVRELVIEDPEAIKNKLASKAPGLAIWSCRNLNGEISDELASWVDAQDQNLSRHAAIALGLLDDRKALPVLREIVREKDDFIPSTGRSENSKRICAAIFLIGRLGGKEDVDILQKLLTDPGPAEFDIFTMALTAALKIADRLPELKEDIADRVLPVVETPKFKTQLVLKSGLCRKDVTEFIQRTVEQKLKSI